MAMTTLPATLPFQVDQLIEELDALNPVPVVTGPITAPEQVQELVFQAGRRSIVDELLRLLEKSKEGPR